MGILYFYKFYAVFPLELAWIDFLKMNLLFSSLEVSPYLLLADIWKLLQMHWSTPYVGKSSENMSHRSNILLLAQHAWNALLYSSQVDWLHLLLLRADEWRGIRDARFVLGRRLQFGTHKSGRWCVGKKNWEESDLKAVGGPVLCKYYRCWDTGCHNLLLLTMMRNPVWAFLCNTEMHERS